MEPQAASIVSPIHSKTGAKTGIIVLTHQSTKGFIQVKYNTATISATVPIKSPIFSRQGFMCCSYTSRNFDARFDKTGAIYVLYASKNFPNVSLTPSVNVWNIGEMCSSYALFKIENTSSTAVFMVSTTSDKGFSVFSIASEILSLLSMIGFSKYWLISNAAFANSSAPPNTPVIKIEQISDEISMAALQVNALLIISPNAATKSPLTFHISALIWNKLANFSLI